MTPWVLVMAVEAFGSKFVFLVFFAFWLHNKHVARAGSRFSYYPVAFAQALCGKERSLLGFETFSPSSFQLAHQHSAMV